MKVLICSDSHGRLDYFQKVLDIEKPDIVIFAGDYSTDALNIALAYDNIEFKIVRGNCDYHDYETKEKLNFEIKGKKFFLTHGHLQGVKANLNEIQKEAMNEGADVCIFGHTHKEVQIKHGGILFLNPGALMDKKYIIYNENKFEQKKLK